MHTYEKLGIRLMLADLRARKKQLWAELKLTTGVYEQAGSRIDIKDLCRLIDHLLGELERLIKQSNDASKDPAKVEAYINSPRTRKMVEQCAAYAAEAYVIQQQYLDTYAHTISVRTQNGRWYRETATFKNGMEIVVINCRPEIGADRALQEHLRTREGIAQTLQERCLEKGIREAALGFLTGYKGKVTEQKRHQQDLVNTNAPLKEEKSPLKILTREELMDSSVLTIDITPLSAS